ncbi:hypothetical protein [Kribbella swartbergensis]
MMDHLYAEVVRHHDDLATWLSGVAGPELLETFGSAHRRDFTLITIDGACLDLPALMTSLAGAQGAAPGLTISIEEFEVLVSTDDVAVCRFLERHTIGSSRRVTAVLTPDAQARYGVRWLSVHETAVSERT